MIEIVVREHVRQSKNKTRKLYSFRVWTDSTRQWGLVPYHVEALDHVEERMYNFKVRYWAKLARRLWLPYQVLRTFLTEVYGKRKFAKYELEDPNK